MVLVDDGRKAVAVIGDGALPSGIVFEAMNNTSGLKKDLLVILNDNKMGICPRVGGLANYLDKARVAPFYNGLKRDISWLLNRCSRVTDPREQSPSYLTLSGSSDRRVSCRRLGARYSMGTG